MKIKHLISKLNKLNPEAEVIVSSDAEGNNYSQLGFIFSGSETKYRDVGYGIEIVNRDEIDESFTEKDYNKAKDCIVLYPN